MSTTTSLQHIYTARIYQSSHALLAMPSPTGPVSKPHEHPKASTLKVRLMVFCNSVHLPSLFPQHDAPSRSSNLFHPQPLPYHVTSSENLHSSPLVIQAYIAACVSTPHSVASPLSLQFELDLPMNECLQWSTQCLDAPMVLVLRGHTYGRSIVRRSCHPPILPH